MSDDWLTPAIVSPVVLVLHLVLIAVVVESNRVELLEWINDSLASGCSQSRIERHAFWQSHEASCSTDINTLTFFHISEVHRVDTASLMRNHRRLHVSDKCPLGCAEERMGLNIGSTSSCSKSPVFILD